MLGISPNQELSEISDNQRKLVVNEFLGPNMMEYSSFLISVEQMSYEDTAKNFENDGFFDCELQSVTKLVDRSGVNGNNPPFPPFQCCKIKNFVLFHVILDCNALSIVFQQIYATLKRGRGGSFIKLHNYLR